MAPGFSHSESHIIHALAESMGHSVFLEANISLATEEVPFVF